MPATAPYEIISGPIEVYRAPTGTAFTDVSQPPAVAWVLVGTSGSKNYTEDGVTIRHMQEIEADAFRMLGTTGPRGAIRTSEMFEIEFVLADLKIAEYANAMNGPGHTVTTVVAGALVGGQKKIKIARGPFVLRSALLIRGTNLSAEATADANNYNLQYNIPIAYSAGEPEVVFSKGQPVGLQFIYRVIEHATDGFGEIIEQTAAPS